MTVPKVGNYSVKAFSETTSGILETNESVSLLPVPSNRSFIPVCQYKPFTTNTPHATATPRPTATATQSPTPSVSTSSPFVATSKFTSSGKIRTSAAFHNTAEFTGLQTSIPISETAAGGLSNRTILIAAAGAAGFLILGIIIGWLICRAKKEKQGDHSPDGKSRELADMSLLELETPGKRRK
jgi:hypothetical protein